MRKLHIGGQVQAADWEVLDVNPGPAVNHVGDASDLRRFADGTFSAIYASHVVEHFDYLNSLLTTLKEWWRVLEPGGILYVSVPDMDVLARLFLDRIGLSLRERFSVMRMMFGGHVDKHDFHLVGLNDELLVDVLGAAGFVDVRRVENFGLFSDTSSTVFKGVAISLNVICTKPI